MQQVLCYFLGFLTPLLFSGVWKYIMVEHKKKFAIEHAKYIHDHVNERWCKKCPLQELDKMRIFTRTSKGYFVYTFHCFEECPYYEQIGNFIEKEIFDATINREGDYTSGFNNLYYAPNYEKLVNNSEKVCDTIYEIL